jgi:hypothetical protein
MLPPVRLASGDVAPGRPFTDAVRTAEDLAAVHAMIAGLRHALAGALPGAPRPLALAVPAPPGRQHRAIVCDEPALRATRRLALVGFFACKRPEVDPAPLTATDDALVAEFPGHPGILSYSSLELPDGNWGNLIVLDRPESAERWRESARHGWAAGELAPRHYRWVRLHHAVLPGGVVAGEVVLVRTRYLDYQGPEPWQAERAAAP